MKWIPFLLWGVIVGACALPFVFTMREKEEERRRTGPVPFDRGLWLAEKRDTLEENWRNRMAEDVVRRWVKPGMTKGQVMARLGKDEARPAWIFDRETVVDPVRPGEVSVLQYVIWTDQHEDGCGAENAVFVYLDGNDRVTRAVVDATFW